MSDRAVHVLIDLCLPGLTDASITAILDSVAGTVAVAGAGDEAALASGSGTEVGALDERLGQPRPGASRFGAVRILVRESDRAAVTERSDSGWKLDFSADRIAAANASFAAAAECGTDLLVLRGTGAPTNASLHAMSALFKRDPFFAFVTPRYSRLGEELVSKLDSKRGDPLLATLPMSAIRSLPEYHLFSDQISDAVLVRGNVVRDFETLDAEFDTLWGGLRDLMARARRVGFRSVIANRAFVANYAEIPDSSTDDRQRIYTRYPEVRELDEEWDFAPIHEYESLIGRAQSASVELRKTLLLDLSDLGPGFNGTSEAVIGLLWGLQECRSDWKISLLVSPEVAQFHDLDSHFPQFEHVWSESTGRYTAVLRPIQPWALNQLERLHRLGLFNFVVMFDTISNEIRLQRPLGLEQDWAQMAKSADGLLYISQFTRDLFRTRFPVHETVDECVSSLSCHPGDYCKNQANTEGSSDGDFIFVIGNDYPHKWLAPTIADLVSAFPYQSFKSLGFHDQGISQLSAIPSGEIEQDTIDRLYSEARVLVYPSQYEGFGFPVIRGLSNGKTVIARRSKLLDELADRYRGPGRLLAFETRTDLVELVGRVLHGLDVEEMPLGNELAPTAVPDNHVDVAAKTLRFIENRIAKTTSSNWNRRQAFFDAANVHHMTRGG